MEKRAEDGSTQRRGGNTWMIFLVLLVAVALILLILVIVIALQVLVAGLPPRYGAYRGLRP